MTKTFTRRPMFFGALVSISLFGFSFFWQGWDWYISESHAALISSALFKFREIPYFSFFWNQGSYLMQDLVSPLFSILTPLLLIFPPTLALRLVIAIVSLVGFLGAYYWLNRHLSQNAALVGAAAWSLNSWTTTRIAVGNDMFIYILFLPLLLLAVQNVIERRTIKSSWIFGFLLGTLLLAPSIHAVIYVIAPSGTLWLLFYSLQNKMFRPDNLKKVLPLFSLSAILVFIIIFPRLIAARHLLVVRNVPPENVMPFSGFLSALFFPFFAGPHPLSWWGEYGPHESHVAPLFSVSLLFLIATFYRAQFTKILQRQPKYIIWFIVSSMIFGTIFVFSQPLFLYLNSITHISLRLLPRFTLLYALPFSYFAAVAWEAIMFKFGETKSNKSTNLFLFAHILVFFLSVLPFYIPTSRQHRPDLLYPKFPISMVTTDLNADSEPQMKAIRSTDVRSDVTSKWSSYNPTAILSNFGLIGLPHSMGNTCHNEVAYGHACLEYLGRTYQRFGPPGTKGAFCRGDCSAVRVTHNHVYIQRTGFKGVAILDLKLPEKGFETVPDDLLKIEPDGPESIKLSWDFSSQPKLSSIVLKVKSPMTMDEFIFWIGIVSVFLLYISIKKLRASKLVFYREKNNTPV